VKCMGCTGNAAILTSSHTYLSLPPQGQMQKHYEHSVPKDAKQVGDIEMRRIVLVFRHGTEKYYNRDTGQPVVNILWRDVSLRYGFDHTPGLVEGDVYTRRVIHDMGAHW
jgi:hypothetical protein